MPTRNAYNDIPDGDALRGEKSAEVFLVNIDAGKRALIQEKAEYRDAVKKLVSVHKKYLSVRRKSEGKSTTRKNSRLSRAEDDVRLAVNVAEDSERRAMNLLKKCEDECNALFDYYFKNGKQRLAKKENDKFDKYYLKEETEIKRIGFPVKDIVESFSENKPERNERPLTDESVAYRQTQRTASPRPENNYGYPPPHGYDTGVPHYPPYPPRYYDPYAYRQSVNISPVNLDVTGIVEEAIKDTMDRFAQTLEKRLDAYEKAAEESVEKVQEQVPVIPDEVIEVAQKGNEAVEKISELLSRLEGILQSVNELGRTINDMQRTALRDMQGVQVKQKLVNQEQDALAEEQELARQRQAIVAENQKNLNERIASLVDAVDLLAKTHAENEASLKAALSGQKSTAQSAAKSLELQKELSAKQLELALAVREAISAQKQAEKILKGPISRKRNQHSTEEKEEVLMEKASSEPSDSAPQQEKSEPKEETVSTITDTEAPTAEAEVAVVEVEAPAAEAEALAAKAEAPAEDKSTATE